MKGPSEPSCEEHVDEDKADREGKAGVVVGTSPWSWGWAAGVVNSCEMKAEAKVRAVGWRQTQTKRGAR